MPWFLEPGAQGHAEAHPRQAGEGVAEAPEREAGRPLPSSTPGGGGQVRALLAFQGIWELGSGFSGGLRVAVVAADGLISKSLRSKRRRSQGNCSLCLRLVRSSRHVLTVA